MKSGHSTVVVFVVFVVISLSTCAPPNDRCMKENKKKSKKDCRGPLKKVDSRLCRAGNLPADGKLCNYQHRTLQLNDNFCSSPLGSHSGRLRRQPIPERLMFSTKLGKASEDIAVAISGVRGVPVERILLCKIMQEHPRYEPPSKRTPTKKVWTITLNCLNFLIICFIYFLRHTATIFLN